MTSNSGVSCPRCRQKMALINQFVDDVYSSVAECDDCGVRVNLGTVNKYKDMKKTDKTERVMKIKIPKLKNQFYTIESDKN